MMAAKFDLEMSANGKYMFNLKAGNGQVILTSQMYESKAAAEQGIESVRSNAEADDNFERKTSKSGQPYFVLKATNDQIIGTSEMYSAEAAMENGIASVKANAPTARVADKTED
jgi:uncharacterized protein YegP (UPF0339 family)